MRQILIIPIVTISLLCIASSCTNRDDTLYPWGWKALGRPTDSLTVALEEAFIGDASYDSCAALVKKYHAIANRADAPGIEKARAICWDARLAFVSEDYEEALKLFRQSAAATDSAKYPFDINYIDLCVKGLEGKIADFANWDWETYERMADDFDYCMTHNAPAIGAIRAQYLSCFMTSNGNPTRALKYALTADSLYASIGRNTERLDNRMNIAANRVLLGDTAGAIRDYAWISDRIAHGVRHSPILELLVDYNRWVEGKDTTSLMQLRKRTAGNPSVAAYDALASAFLAEIEIKNRKRDSLPIRVRDMEAGLSSLPDGEQKAVVVKMLGRSYKELGDLNKAYSFLNLYPDNTEKVIQVLGRDTYGVAETERHINNLEVARRESLSRERIKNIIIICAILSLLIASAAWGIIKIKALRKEKKQREIDLEHSKRKELTMSLSMQEKQRQIDELRQKVSQLADDELIAPEAVRNIESSIRSAQGSLKADEEFGKIFETISPKFSQRLREIYPRIGKNTLRMAEYIAIGMDNRHIARVMNIRPESVKQNRWRLRQALGLDSDSNLDFFLHDLL